MFEQIVHNPIFLHPQQSIIELISAIRRSNTACPWMGFPREIRRGFLCDRMKQLLSWRVMFEEP